jgi:acyl dehydratase
MSDLDHDVLRINGIDGLGGYVGQHLGYSSWLVIGQDRIDAFAAATDDHQWIHVDPDRAAKGPFGTTVAHGYLTLSLLPALIAEVYQVDGVAMRINYGLNRVRFPAPVPRDARVRAGVELLALEPVTGGARSTTRVTVEIEGGAKPACVAETVSWFLAADGG